MTSIMNGSNRVESNGQMGLPEIIQMCCQANRSGQIIYRASEKAGAIFLQHGQVIHASADGFEGAEAIFRMLGWPAGTFNFDESLLPNKRTVTQSWEQLLFEGGEETFGRSVIEAGSRLASAGAGAVLVEDAGVRRAQVLTAAVRVMNEASSWSSTDQRHLQRVGGQFGAQVVGERPAHDPSAERIQNDRQV